MPSATNFRRPTYIDQQKLMAERQTALSIVIVLVSVWLILGLENI